MAGDQLSLTAAVLPHPHVANWTTAGVTLSPDDKAEPEPDVAAEHEEADEKNQVDGLVVRGSARLLDLDQGGVVDSVVGVQRLLCLARRGASRCQLLGLKAQHPLARPGGGASQKSSLCAQTQNLCQIPRSSSTAVRHHCTDWYEI